MSLGHRAVRMGPGGDLKSPVLALADIEIAPFVQIRAGGRFHAHAILNAQRCHRIDYKRQEMMILNFCGSAVLICHFSAAWADGFLKEIKGSGVLADGGVDIIINNNWITDISLVL